MKSDAFQNISIAGMIGSIADKFEKKTGSLEPSADLDYRRPFHVDEIRERCEGRPMIRRDDRPVLCGEGRLLEPRQHLRMVRTETFTEQERPVVFYYFRHVEDFAHRDGRLRCTGRSEIENGPRPSTAQQ